MECWRAVRFRATCALMRCCHCAIVLVPDPPPPPHTHTYPPGGPLRLPFSAAQQAVAAARDAIASNTGELQSRLQDVRAKTLGNLDTYEARYLPTVHRYDL